ncbi:TM0106 family RecB-like putative nuclease [Jiangella asiatica]|uniref:TM0106 family RecB-like putative nuclease n=1 Tax=Jiangella asiatica TaxID=2530372 RepID=A0A4R5D9A0_9ACTN|nr:TM0106 family RecB-like putative nuclease [Jiangella asiatica]TDE10116.1 TM0106 family RecB-like putative nuclease [Jiangella asiatica]
MYVVAGHLVLSPTDLVAHLECPHLTTLNREVAEGRRPRPTGDDPAAGVVRRRGDEHEAAVLAEMSATHRVVSIPRSVGPAEAEDLTLTAMKDGADRIFQATFYDGRWRGYADFLIRNDEHPSHLGPWSYDIADTKLARQVKASALLQMAVYAQRLEHLQGVPPQTLTVILGNRLRVSVAYVDVAAYARHAMREYGQWLADPPQTYPLRVNHCAICPWHDTCDTRWRADDDLVLVPFLRRDQRAALRAAGIDTVDALASASAQELAAVPRVGASTKRKLATQARLQIAARSQEVPPYQLVTPVEPRRGLTLLPEPDAADLFLDLEGDPFFGDHGIEYLWGISDVGDEFRSWWAHDAVAEKHAFEQVVDHIMATWQRRPGMHVYHYAPYEPSRLKELSQRYGTRVDEVDALLRGERLVDLYAVVRQGLRVGTESYSIKALERFYDPRGRAGAAVKDAGSSIVEYERWLAEHDQSILDDIEAYNRDDCISTRQLRDWLEDRRAEALDDGHAVPRPTDVPDHPAEHLKERAPELVAVEEKLLDGVPGDPAARTAEQQARALLAGLLEWHRRENRAEWWEYFRVRTLAVDELVDDPATLGGLHSPELLRTEKRSGVWRYGIPPQECRLRPGDQAGHADPDGGTSKILRLDLENGVVELKRALAKEQPHPLGLLAPDPIPAGVLEASLCRVGGWVADHGFDADGPYRGVRDLLLGRQPRLADGVELRLAGESGADALRRVAPSLYGALPVQGPPGAGKTYAGSHAVVELLRSGKTVGITALSHRVITHLLDAVLRADDGADGRGRVVRAIQKADDGNATAHPDVTVTTSNDDVETALATGSVNLVAGTGWLFARPGVHVDVLVVDEAGQFSLANAVAAGAAADSVVLLGDPRQLPQPARGIHPDGAGVSALDHVLGEHDTIPPEYGLFLDTTWRMHPAVCAPVSELSYDGLLGPRNGLERQQVHGDGPLAGAGIRWFPVAHTGCSVRSDAEVAVVSDLVDQLTGRLWTDADGVRRDLTSRDILVVAPYNAQVGQLLAVLDGRARVGTVDKFQGQEAPVVIVSLTTSSAADAPRGVDFVANRNRLNVAVSRARSLAVLVGSPALLTAPVRSIDQVQGVNTLCRLVEYATS